MPLADLLGVACLVVHATGLPDLNDSDRTVLGCVAIACIAQSIGEPVDAGEAHFRFVSEAVPVPGHRSVERLGPDVHVDGGAGRDQIVALKVKLDRCRHIGREAVIDGFPDLCTFSFRIVGRLATGRIARVCYTRRACPRSINTRRDTARFGILGSRMKSP